MIGTLIAAGQHWRTQCVDVPQCRALITGETSTADYFLARVDAYLETHEAGPQSAALFFASFGVFGELPVISVFLSDCYVLIDPTNGNLSGPFAIGSPVDARGLLSTHSVAYQAGTSVRYFAYGGDPVGDTFSAMTFAASSGSWLGRFVDSCTCTGTGGIRVRICTPRACLRQLICRAARGEDNRFIWTGYCNPH